MATASVPTEDSSNEGKVKCKEHPNALADFVCADCSNKPVCTGCSISDHTGHSLIEMQEHITAARARIQQYVVDMETQKLPAVMEQIRELQVEIDRNLNEREALKRQIQERGEMVKDNVDKMTRKATRKLKEEKFENETKLTIHKEHLENIQTEYNMKLQEYNREHQSAVESGCQKRLQEVEQKYPELPVRPTFPDIVMSEFVPGTIDRETISACFGTITINGVEIDTDDDAAWRDILRRDADDAGETSEDGYKQQTEEEGQDNKCTDDSQYGKTSDDGYKQQTEEEGRDKNCTDDSQ